MSSYGLRFLLCALQTLLLYSLLNGVASAQGLPFLPAGDSRLRHEVELNRDEERVPLSTTWPIPLDDIPERYRETTRSVDQPGSATDAGWFLQGGANPTKLRVYEQTPRESAEAGVRAGWAAGDYSGGVVRFSYALHPSDQMHYRLDGTYASWKLGNWWATLGAQERWWGPGWDGSLIFGNNARPMPGVTLERASSIAPQSKWLSWIGPWRLVTFLDRMETSRPDYGKINFWGARVTFAPITGVEIGLTRTAQLCGVGRPCGLRTYFDMLTARKNLIVDESGNPDINSKPAGNHSAIDVRWHIGHSPVSIYWQEDVEAIYSTNYGPTQTLQLAGIELAGRSINEGRTRTFLEYADTACEGSAIGQPYAVNFGCAYEKDTYLAGYRFRGRSIGDAMDRDGRRFTLGHMYTDEAGRFWQLRLRRLEINRGGVAQPGLVPHTLSTVPRLYWTIEPSVGGQFHQFNYTVGGALDQTNTFVYGPGGDTGFGHKIGYSGHFFASISASW